MSLATFLWEPDIQTFMLHWLPIVFMGLLVVAVFALMRYMPRTKPVEIKPEASPSIGWSDIAGSDEAKEELREVVEYLRDPKRFRELGAKVPKGILLHGPPGTGKTLLAKAVAHESGASFYSQSAASFVEMFAGLGAARIRRLFRIARQTAGLTGADLANICNEAAIFAARRSASQVAMQDFDAALERVVAGMQSRRALTDHEKRVVAFHEAGHALCGELLPSVDRVHRISIVPRGKALGYTLNLPEEDRYLKTREELIDYMTMLLGGRAAEQIVFGSITTGASDDLKRVADIAHAMIHEYAMGTGSGSLRAIDDGAAEATRRVRDAEVRELADEALRSAQRLVDSHRPQLDELASTLLANEVLERGDIDRIMGDVPRAAPSRIGELSIAAATAVNPVRHPDHK